MLLEVVADFRHKYIIKVSYLVLVYNEEVLVVYAVKMAIYTGKDANRPKRPQSAYILWLADFRAQMKDKFVENKELLRAG